MDAFEGRVGGGCYMRVVEGVHLSAPTRVSPSGGRLHSWWQSSVAEEEDEATAVANAQQAPQGVLLTVASEAERDLSRKELKSLFEMDGRESDSSSDIFTSPSGSEFSTPARRSVFSLKGLGLSRSKPKAQVESEKRALSRKFDLFRGFRSFRLLQVQRLLGCKRPEPQLVVRGRVTDASRMDAQRWFVSLGRPARCNHRMVILPCAGGNSFIYSQWSWENCETILTQLPGRDSRSDESRDADIYRLAQQLAQALMDLGYHADVPFSLLGHCWGSYVALETAMVLKKVYNVSPAKLFVLSLVPPEVMPLAGLCFVPIKPIKAVLFYHAGGLPAGVFEWSDRTEGGKLNKKALRDTIHDMKSFDKYICPPEKQLSCDIVAIMGQADPLLKLNTHGDIALWAEYTQAGFDLLTIKNSKHFVVLEEENVPMVLDFIGQKLHT
jgi:medium-chain acyl-[acyl-carrier-protein] hydrolase